MLTLNETFAVPDADRAWSVINDLNALVPCVPGASVRSVDGAQSVKATIEVRMGAMGMTFSGPVTIESTDADARTVTIKATTRETLGQSYATGDITICLGDDGGTIDAIANVGGKAAGMGEGVIVNVLTDLVTAFSSNVAKAVDELAGEASGDNPAPSDAVVVQPAAQPAAQAPAADAAQPVAAGDDALERIRRRAQAALAGARSTSTANGGDAETIFQSLTRRFGGRLDVKLTSGPDDAPLLKSAGQSFAMLHGGELVVRLHPARCAELVGAGKGRLFVHDGRTTEDWLVVNGLDAAEWTGHTMEALGGVQD
jgi:carbon monoxide dehydrogenase subunit G